MLLAVNMGRPQSPKSLLSRRRSSRRLLLVNLPCIVAFTRNPSWLRVLRKVDTFSNPGNTERFRVFYEILPPIIGGFASLRARLGFQLLLLLRVCLCVRRIAVSQNWLTRRQR